MYPYQVVEVTPEQMKQEKIAQEARHKLSHRADAYGMEMHRLYDKFAVLLCTCACWPTRDAIPTHADCVIHGLHGSQQILFLRETTPKVCPYEDTDDD